MSDILDTSQIKDWRSIITLIIFVVTNVIVLFPFHVPIYVPRVLYNGALDSLSAVRILSPRPQGAGDGNHKSLMRFRFPVNLVTAPLIADLFLLAILAIGREEVYDGTVGTDHIYPIEIMAFFITLAYIAISIDSSGAIRFLSFKVLQRGGKSGRLLYFYLYLFFFGLATLIGNDPIVLSGTPFLAYMTRASSNIEDPKAWIFTQFAVSNVASAILVSSNPTNLVLAGAFNIKFIDYTVNIIVPVLVTAILLLPFLLFILFRNESLIPASIKQHELPEEMKAKKPVNPNIPFAKGAAEKEQDDEKMKLLLLEEIMNPYLDKKSALVGATVMAATLVTILVLNASSQNGSSYPAYWITSPGAFVMLCWDVSYGWLHRAETRRIAHEGREEFELARVEQGSLDVGEEPRVLSLSRDSSDERNPSVPSTPAANDQDESEDGPCERAGSKESVLEPCEQIDGRQSTDHARSSNGTALTKKNQENPPDQKLDGKSTQNPNLIEKRSSSVQPAPKRTTLVGFTKTAWTWSRETFPTVTTVLSLLPFPLVPFGLTMFVLVQALVTKGWVAVFAYGWEHWTDATGTVGAIVGMGFLSVVLCNFAGTNIGTTILLCRVVQAWEIIHERNGTPITQRTFWATVYSMALGLNYGAFSTAFSASLAGLLWRDILARKKIHVRSRDFVLVNLPIISVAMIVGCLVLIGEVYIVRKTTPYKLS